MRTLVLVLGLLGVATPVHAQSCNERLTQAVAAQDAARIESFVDGEPQRQRAVRGVLMQFRGVLEEKFARIVVHRRQLKALEEVEAGSKALSNADVQALAQFKNHLVQEIERLDASAKVLSGAMEKLIAVHCEIFEEKAAAERRAKAPTGGTTTTAPPVDRRPPSVRYGTSAVLEMAGEPKPQAKFGGWKAVEAGKLYLEDPNYKITATWTELPQSIGPEGIDITLKIPAWAKTNVNTGVQIRVGSLEIERKGKKEDFGSQPLDLAVIAEKGQEVTKEMTVHIKPGKSYTMGAAAWVSVGIFYGLKVDYNYKAVKTGND